VGSFVELFFDFSVFPLWYNATGMERGLVHCLGQHGGGCRLKVEDGAKQLTVNEDDNE
jgi:hypothetical protein